MGILVFVSSKAILSKPTFPFSVTGAFSLIFTLVSLLFFCGMALFLLIQGSPIFFQEQLSFITDADWFYRINQYGAASMIYGTILVSFLAIVLSLPFALGSAILTSEFLPNSIRVYVKSFIELLAGIPSVVYGLLGVLFLRPLIFKWFAPFSPESGDTLLTASVILAVMILPTVMSLSEDALRGVSKEHREVALSLGLTRLETFVHGVLPRAIPGIIAAVLLGLGRALGETIAVYLVIGRADNRLSDSLFSLKPLFEAGQTITSKLGGSELYIAYGEPTHWSAMIGLGLILFVFVGVIVAMGEAVNWLGRKYQHG